MTLRTNLVLALLALLLVLPLAAPAATSPPAPYWSVHVASYPQRAAAVATLQGLAQEPSARIEKRKTWSVRFGAWADRAEADRAVERYRAKFKDARVLQIENPVEWIVPAEAAATAAAAPAGQPGATPVAPAAAGPTAAETDARFKAAAQALDAQVRAWLEERGAVRADGYTYGMDVAPLLLYAALRRDAGLYETLLASARPLVVDGDDAKGFVLWRHKDGEAPEVSGTTEALWLARGLWAGQRLLKRTDDRALAAQVLDGYARHASGDGNAWRVAKYYAFGTKSYASLSVLPNYHPDFLDEAADSAPSAGALARRSYGLLQRAVTPSKLLVPLVQPDIATVMPGLGVSLYAPNGLVSLDDSCAAAEGALRGVPQLAQNVLAFATGPGSGARRDVNGRLFAYYHRKDGRPLGTQGLSSTGYACLGRLAAATRNKAALPALKAALAGDMESLAGGGDAAPLYAAGPLLIAADALGAL